MLRDALFDRLSDATPPTQHPTALIELADGPEPLAESDVPLAGCDSASAAVEEKGREPGAYEATVKSRAPVDVVIRATFTPTWTVLVDGAAATPKLVVPGFFAVRVPAGEHRVEAVFQLPAHYVLIVAGAFAVVTVLGLLYSMGPSPWRRR
jgi:hypothetical protein